MKYISIGNRSSIGRGTLIQPIMRYLMHVFNPSIIIEDDVYIGNRCTISATADITIGKGTTIGDHVFIGGGRHGYEKPDISVLEQQLVVGSIRIGACAWIGYGSFIASAGTLEIGEHVIIAANSVVNRSVPAFTMVAGAPAKPIKYFDVNQQKWLRIQSAVS